MPKNRFTNNASGALASSITNVATAITLATGKGALFPALAGGDYFYATLVDASNNLEIVKVTARSGDSLTVVRGQEGTTARAYTAGDILELRPTAAGLENLAALDADQTFSGAITFSQAINGSVSGNAGTVTNGVYTTGAQSIAGTKTFADISFSDSGFKAYVSSTYSILLFDNVGGNQDYFAYDRTNNVLSFAVAAATKFSCDASGNFTAAGNVTAYSDERIKVDWAELPDLLVERLSKVRAGTYTRSDTGARQIGVSAQALREVMPEAVVGDGTSEDRLSVAYGNAALAAAVALAREVMELRRRIENLEG